MRLGHERVPGIRRRDKTKRRGATPALRTFGFKTVTDSPQSTFLLYSCVRPGVRAFLIRTVRDRRPARYAFLYSAVGTGVPLDVRMGS